MCYAVNLFIIVFRHTLMIYSDFIVLSANIPDSSYTPFLSLTSADGNVAAGLSSVLRFLTLHQVDQHFPKFLRL